MNLNLNTQTVSPFPNPPEYASAYTSDRIDNGSAPPPPHPLTEFKVFGEDYKLEDDIIASLAAADIQQFYGETTDSQGNKKKLNWKEEMKKLNRSAIVAFFDLVEILIRSPDHPMREEKLADLHVIFINMHHLINEFRPVQARDSVRILQERQIAELSEICDDFRLYISDGREVVEDQFKMVGGKLAPPPKPSELTGITLQNGALHKLIAKEIEEDEEEDVEMKDVEEAEKKEKKASEKKKMEKLKILETSREGGPPSVIHLLTRQMNEITLKK